MGIAEPAVAAAQQHEPLIGPGQVREYGFLVVVEDLGPDRDAQYEVAAIGAGPVGPRPAAPVLGPEMLLIAVIDQRVQIVGRDKDDIAALAAHTAVGPAELDELLAAKAHRAAAAIAALEVDLALIEEFHGSHKLKRERLGRSPRVPSVGETAIRRPPPVGRQSLWAGQRYRYGRRGLCGTAPRPLRARTACGRGPCRRARREETWCRAGAR